MENKRLIVFASVACVMGVTAFSANVVTLQNARYRAEVNLDQGGLLIGFYDKCGDGLSNNLLNGGAQPTFRGNGYTAVIASKPASAHNLSNNGHTLAITDNSIVNANNGQPMKASLSMRYDLHDDFLSVSVSFLDSTGVSNNASDHELPALYVVPELSTFVFCQASGGWTGAELTSIAKPGFWGGNPDAYKSIPSDERWCAWTNPTSKRGVGVYSPFASTMLMGRPTDSSSSYAAPLAHEAMKSGTTASYVYYLAAGTLGEMRDIFAAIRFGLGEVGNSLGKSGVRIDCTKGRLDVASFDPEGGKLSFSGRFIGINGKKSSEDFALVCRSNLVEKASEFLLPVGMSVKASGENELAAVEMTMTEPPPSLFVMGVAERPSPYVAQMVAKGFPETYATLMAALHERHPKWAFEPLFVSDMTWDAVLDKEMVPARNLVVYSTWAPSPWNALGLSNYTPYYAENAQAYDSGSYYQASRAAVAYFMDPRNFLNDTEVFMFETLAFNESLHTQAAIEKALAGSFMANSCYDGGTKKFSELILSVGRKLGVSPVFLAGRLKSEQGNGSVQARGTIGDSLWELYADEDGKVGNSNVWGKNYTKDNDATAAVIAKGKAYYNGYYNLFNIGASGTGLFEIRYNAWKEAFEASKEKYQGPWTTQEKALYGGSCKVKEAYIDTCRHTSYLQKFSVLAEAGSKRWSQYMQNIAAPLTESRSTRDAYITSGSYETEHVFLVPVYVAMPSSPCPDPAGGNSYYSPTR